MSKIALLITAVLATAITASAQSGAQEIYGVTNDDLPVAMGNNLYCAGYIQKSSVNTDREIVGGDDEKEQNMYAEGDEVYINAGSRNGVSVGDMFSVVRPRGKVKSKNTQKKDLGIFIQEVGAVEVIKVHSDVSVARVKTSCSVLLLGDLLNKVEKRTSPQFEKRPELNKFAAPSGKATGNIIMARDGLEMLGREQIVYIDLGREDNVSIGDYLTIYRRLGSGNIYEYVQPEHMDNKEEGYESDRYRGGTFSNKTARKRGSEANGKVVTTENAKSRRPDGLRKIVGELVILNVLERTATAMIVRNTSEIHTGDKVELQ
ncbi:MAG: FlgT C-terminal domain-containing protein [Pyrinomonadaceae bacterium]